MSKKPSLASLEDSITFVSDVVISSPIYYDGELASFNGFGWVPGIGIVVSGTKDERVS